MADNDVKIKVSVDGADTAAKGLSGVGDAAAESDNKLGKLVSGGLKGAGVAVLGFATAAAAAGTALGVSVTKAYADYEQNVGGIETMFGSSAGRMEKYAADAYKTAGLSANEYMSQATSFSAALLQGLGGDTEAAAQVANRAITDMSDNANKFGSNIGDIQNAYQGFAKQNFTMLDNLKLGYGGTASEMARLVNESGVMGGSFTATAENINSVSYDKIIAAIGAVQDKMGITGTTAKEAASTISGSLDTLKGAWQNLLVGLGSSDQDVAALAQNVVASFQQVVTNITPVIQNIGANIQQLGPTLGTLGQSIVGALGQAIPAVVGAGVGLITGLIQGVTATLPGLVTALVPGIVSMVTAVAQLAPQLLWAGVQAVVALAQGLGAAMPTLIPIIVQGLLTLVNYIIQAVPLLIDAGLQLILGLANGLLAAIPQIISYLPTLIQSILDFLSTSIPAIMEAGIQLLLALVQALPLVITALVTALPQIITSIITFLTTSIPQIIQAGIQLFIALIQALPQIIVAIVQAIPQIITSVITAIVNAIPLLIQAGIDLFISLVQALPQIIVAIVAAIPQIIISVIQAIIGAIPQLIQAGISLFTSLIKSLPQIITTIVQAVPQIISGLVSEFGKALPQMAAAGLNLIKGLWNGISDAASWLYGKISGFVGGVVDKIKGFFGIHSPSTVLADEVGKWLPAGIGVGVTLNAEAAIKPIQDLNAQILDEAGKLNTMVAFTHDATLTQTLVPMQATPQQAGAVTVQATVDPTALTAAIADGFSAQNNGDQPAVRLDPQSIRELGTYIVDSMRVQSRQGVVSLG